MSRTIFEHAQNHMATTFVFRVSCQKSRMHAVNSVLSEAHALISRIEGEVSEFLPNSELTRLNGAAVCEKFIPRSQFLIDLLKISERIFIETGGAFDPSFRSYGTGDFRSRFAWDSEFVSIQRKTEDARLGFGAIGKGFALDQVRTLLEREGFGDFLLSAGGSSLVLSGAPAQNQSWPLGWSWEKKAGEYFGTQLRCSARRGVIAVGVSGNLEQGEHIVRRESEDRFMSIFTAGCSAAETDAYSTALYSDGWKNAGEWFSRISTPIAAAGISATDRLPIWNQNFQDWFGAIAS